jgi:ketosteroid isomerase-like protein
MREARLSEIIELVSRENIEIIRRAYSALNRGDWDAAFRDAHEDFVMTTQRGPSAGTLQGREAAQGFGEDYIQAFDNSVIEPEEFFERGDRVVALVTRRGRPKGEMLISSCATGTCGPFGTARSCPWSPSPTPRRLSKPPASKGYAGKQRLSPCATGGRRIVRVLLLDLRAFTKRPTSVIRGLTSCVWAA